MLSTFNLRRRSSESVRQQSSNMETKTAFNKIDSSLSESQPSGDQPGSATGEEDTGAYQYLRPSWWNPTVHDQITPAVIWNGFKEQTTAHGIPRLASAKGVVKNVFWGTAVALAFSFLLYNFAKITATFFAFQTNVRLSLQNENQLKFPVVTLCNMNPLRRTAMAEWGLIDGDTYGTSGEREKRDIRSRRAVDTATTAEPLDLTEQCCCTCCQHTLIGDDVITDCNTCGAENVTEAATCAVANITTPPTTTTTTTAAPHTTTTTTVYKPASVPGSIYPERIQTTEKFQKENKITEFVSNMAEDDKTKMGYNSSEMIIDCHYAGSECNLSSFVKFFNPTHGNCYMFNSGWDKDSHVRTASKTGRRYGLQVIININQAEYSDTIGDTAGVRMVIHPQNRMPFPEDEGITVSPGRATSVGIRQVVVTREDHPYSDCVDPDLDHSDIDMYEELYPVSYSANACQKTCYQLHVIRECGCADAYLPMHAAALSSTNVKSCNSSNITQDDCKYAVSRRFNNNSLNCNCQDSCRDITFTNEVSFGEWPSETQKEALLEKYKDKIGSSFDIYDDNAYKENLVKLEVYYEEFNFETIDEVPSYKPGRYLSDIGGALGLWVGFSILSIAEFIELAMDLIVYLSGSLRRRSQTSRTGTVDNKGINVSSQTLSPANGEGSHGRLH